MNPSDKLLIEKSMRQSFSQNELDSYFSREKFSSLQRPKKIIED